MPDTKEISFSSAETVQLKDEIISLQMKLKAQELEISSLKADKEKFIGMIAHDLRNPLGVILAFSGFFTADIMEGLTDIQKDFISRINNSAKFMIKLIADLLDLSLIDNANIAINSEMLNIVSLVSRSIENNKIAAAKKNMSFISEGFDANIYINGDLTRLEQVFNILFSNAIKFSPFGSAITAHISKNSENVSIKITDCGKGIAFEDRKKIFIPFDKIAGKGSDGEKGTGLGLAIAAKIAGYHKGEIIVESEEGKGSSFIVTLPL